MMLTFSGITIEANLLQFLNASVPILSIVLGRVMERKSEKPLNAPDSIFTTLYTNPLCSTSAGIFTFSIFC